MKKLLILAAAAALLLASCAKVETTTKNTMAENAPIVFSNYAPKSITKAAAANYAAGNVLIANADFDVYGWATANGTSFDGTNGVKSNGHDFMEWYTVTYKADGDSDGSKNAYPDGYRYWPSGDTPDYLHFYAYYPSNGETGITAPAAGLGAFSFTAKTTAATMVDFMVADVVKDKTYDNCTPTAGTVALTFRHMLTRVQFKFKTTQAVVDDTHTTIKVTDVKLYNALTTGTLTSAFNGTATTTTWSAQGTPSASPYEVYVNGADIDNFELTATAAPATNNAADIFLMVPQEMITPAFSNTPHTTTNLSNKPQYLLVNWDVITDGVTTHNSKALYFDTDLKTTDNITGPAATYDLDWAKNASITYTLTIGPQPILFTATVEDWTPELSGFFNVQ